MIWDLDRSPFGPSVMKIYTPCKYGHHRVPIFRDFRDPIVIIGAPLSTQMSDDTDDAYGTGRYG